MTNERLSPRGVALADAVEAYLDVMDTASQDIRDARIRLHSALRDASASCGAPIGTIIRHLRQASRYVSLKDAIDPVDLLKEIQWEMFIAIGRLDRAIAAGVLPSCATEPFRPLLALYPRAYAVVEISEGGDQDLRETRTWVETMIEADSRRYVDLRAGETGLVVIDAAGEIVDGEELDRRLDEFHGARRPVDATAGELVDRGQIK